MDEALLRRVLYGLSCRNYAEVGPYAIGLSRSNVSRIYIEASTAKLRSFQERDLSEHDFLALFLDGKTFAKDMMVIALARILHEQV